LSIKFPFTQTWWLLLLIAICTGCSSSSNTAAVDGAIPVSASVEATKQYTIQQILSIVNEGDASPGKQNLWVALIQDFHPYQQVISKIISPRKHTLVTDEFGNQYAEFDFSNHAPGTAIDIVITYQVQVNEIVYELGDCEGDLLADFTSSELHIESSNPQIIELAKKLSGRKKTTCDQVRAFYDYAGDELIYTYNRNAWGAQATFGLMGSDCTEYASLVIALSRTEGIPARYFEGLLYLEGKEEGIAQTEHAWLDVYFPNIGWVGMDPTLGRSPGNRETYFAHYTPDHIIITTGRNPSTLRGASYWSHLYWPGNVTAIRINKAEWNITLD